MINVRTSPLRDFREPIEVLLPCRSKIRKWAFDNAIMLAVMAFFFVLTWIAIFIVGVWAHVQ